MLPVCAQQKRVVVWGLVDNQQWAGKALDMGSGCCWYSTGWNPVMISPAVKQQILPCSPHEARQLAVGWSQALLLLQDGRLYTCSTDRLQDSCAAAEQAASSGNNSNSLQAGAAVPWQPLQLPAAAAAPPPPPAQQLQCPAVSPAVPRAAAAHQQVIQVAAGDDHCLLLTSTGSVWAFGSNQYGQTGAASHKASQQHQRQGPKATGEPPHSSASAQESQPDPEEHVAAAGCAQPVLVLGPGAVNSACEDPVAQVAAGSCHSAAVTAGLGRLFCWGWNAHGQCCTGTTTSVLQPQLCSALDGVPLTAVAAGMAHTVTVSRDGAVYACGWNSNGQLGVAGSRPTSAGGAAAVDGSASAPQGRDSSVMQDSVRRSNRDNGSSKSLCSSSLQPLLVDSPELEQEHVVQVACGSRHTLVLTQAGSVYAWGWNKHSQCCVVSQPTDVLQPVQVVGQCSDEPQMMKAVAVHAGRWHSCVVMSI